MTMSEYLEFHKGMSKKAYIIYFNRKLDRG